MNLLEAIETIELFTFTEENDKGIECIKAKLNDGFYFHQKYLFEHDLDALIDYTWQMGNFVKAVSETEDEVILFNVAVETIKKYRKSKELKNTILMENVKFIEDEEDIQEDIKENIQEDIKENIQKVQEVKSTKKPSKKLSEKISEKISKKRSISILNKETGGQVNGDKA